MEFLKKAFAQTDTDSDIDTVAAPTFPFTPPFASPTPTVVAEGASIVLSTDKAVLNVGEKFKVTVRVESGREELLQYNIVISYNPSVLKVVDKDTNKSGLQVSYIDTFFQEEVNIASEQLGTIQISGSAPDDTAVSVNRNVGEVEFETLAIGQATLEVSEGQSSLADENRVDILSETTPLIITVQGSTTQPPVGTSTPLPTIIPNTGILDENPFITIFLGSMIIISGFYLGIKYRKKKVS